MIAALYTVTLYVNITMLVGYQYMYQITNNWPRSQGDRVTRVTWVTSGRHEARFVQQLMHKLISLKGGVSVGYVSSLPSCPLSFALLLDGGAYK